VVKSISLFHLHMISDATGETLIAVGRAVASQYETQRAVEHIYPLIRTREQLRDVLAKIHHTPGIVLYTFADKKLGDEVKKFCQHLTLPSISVLDPVFDIFRTYLGEEAGHRASAQHVLDDAYFQRIEALNYTIDHDDGLMPEGLDAADVILVGVSRVSKTPTSIYMANRGVKTANVPLVVGIEPPPQLITAQNPIIVGLIASAERISMVRKNRELGTHDKNHSYTDRSLIIEELHHARQIFTRYNWPVIDVTRRSIEETAAAILSLLDKKKYG